MPWRRVGDDRSRQAADSGRAGATPSPASAVRQLPSAAILCAERQTAKEQGSRRDQAAKGRWDSEEAEHLESSGAGLCHGPKSTVAIGGLRQLEGAGCLPDRIRQAPSIYRTRGTRDHRDFAHFGRWAAPLFLL
jgi:hypothetical protein